jgi:hypothetical protein
MAVDLDAIRKRLAELSGQRFSIQLWKPGIGEHRVRALPWKNPKDGMPLEERWLYYIGKERAFLAPNQFGKPDPVHDLTRKLYSSGDPKDRELAKMLKPSLKVHIPVIVRGEESKGVQVWSFTKGIYTRLLSFFNDEDTVAWMDPYEGNDLKVTIQPSGKMFNGKPTNDTIVDTRKSSKLHESDDQIKKWLESVPTEINSLYPEKSEREIESILNGWLLSDPKSDGDGRNDKSADALTQLTDEIKGSSSDDEKKSKKVAKKVDVDVDAKPSSKKSLDDAFNDLMKEDD